MITYWRGCDVGVAAVTRPCLLQPPVLACPEKTLAFVLEWDIHTAGGGGTFSSYDRWRSLTAVRSMDMVGAVGVTAAPLCHRGHMESFLWLRRREKTKQKVHLWVSLESLFFFFFFLQCMNISAQIWKQSCMAVGGRGLGYYVGVCVCVAVCICAARQSIWMLEPEVCISSAVSVLERGNSSGPDPWDWSAKGQRGQELWMVMWCEFSWLCKANRRRGMNGCQYGPN